MLSICNFSPLLDGESITAFNAPKSVSLTAYFSPLLDGESITASEAILTSFDPDYFSPLLDGESITAHIGDAYTCRDCISVPFSTGNQLLLMRGLVIMLLVFDFSPLLDGESITAFITSSKRRSSCLFQSPSRRGINYCGQSKTFESRLLIISVPFSTGNQLLHSPRFAGRHGSYYFSPLLDGESITAGRKQRHRRLRGAISVPFSTGNQLLPRALLSNPYCLSIFHFSPLLDGESITAIRRQSNHPC